MTVGASDTLIQRTTRTLPVTAFRFDAYGSPPPALASLPSSSGIVLPPMKVSMACLMVGIGREGQESVLRLAAEPTWDHLCWAASSVASCHDGGQVHLVSVALPSRPDGDAVTAACAVGRAIRRPGVFAVATAANPDAAAMYQLGQTFDCVLDGDGSAQHHGYPLRTVGEPKEGRLICYDFYDVCQLWAGRIGTVGVLRPDAAALHVEISTEVETLAEIDALMNELAGELAEPDRLSLVSVVPGLPQRAISVSFVAGRTAFSAASAMRFSKSGIDYG